MDRDLEAQNDAVDSCPVCGTLFPTDDRMDFIPVEEINYCYHCGAKIKNKSASHTTDSRYTHYEFYPVGDNVSIGSVVITENGLDIGLVAETHHGKPTKILSRYNNYHTPSGEIPQYGGIDMVTWYDTRIHMSINEWVDLSKRGSAADFYEYWWTRLGLKPAIILP